MQFLKFNVVSFCFDICVKKNVFIMLFNMVLGIIFLKLKVLNLVASSDMRVSYNGDPEEMTDLQLCLHKAQTFKNAM